MIAIGVDQSDPILDSPGFAFLQVLYYVVGIHAIIGLLTWGSFRDINPKPQGLHSRIYTLQRFSIEPQSVISTLSATQRNQKLRQCKDKPASKFMLSCSFGHLP